MEEAVQQQLDPEVVHGAAEIDRRLPPGADGLEIEGVAGPVEHGQLLLQNISCVALLLPAERHTADKTHFFYIDTMRHI